MKTESMEVGFDQHRFVNKEARTVRGRTCTCCRRYLDGMCFVLFMLHDNGSQYVVVGWQCFDCDRQKANIFYTHSDILGVPTRFRRLIDGSFVIHQRSADEHGPLDVAVWDVDDCDTENDALAAWNDKLREGDEG
jgi:hypothetical protein